MEDFNLRLASVAGLGVAALTSIPAIVSLATQIANRTPKDHFFEDKNGTASPEQIAKFSNRKAKAINTALAAVTFGAHLAAAILVTVQHSASSEHALQTWLSTAAWVCILDPLMLSN